MELHQGGKAVNPQELSQLSDWGARVQPTQMQLQV
ncbi:addiction module toxin RelE [Serratia plymuthica]|uniref:Addiction module toxin RelE n=1 Tax=Serratia plymuthica TaxID=82996 RepID=A0A318P4X8_SERPL|nr:addiction module toxin RelE [Serratia plymuthica]